MKGVIMEIKKDKLILLTKDGRFIEIDKSSNNVDIGEEISISDNRIYNCNVKRFIAVAAMLLIIMTGSYGVYGYYNPYGYVNIDINPSVELTYNLYNRIIDLEGINEDGEYIIDKLGIDAQKNKKIEEVINKFIDKAAENGYMDEKENIVLVTLTDEKKNIDDTELLNLVNDHIEENTANKKEVEFEKEIDIKVVSNTNKNYKISKDKKVSPGKMMLIDKVINTDNSFTEEELYSKSINEIMNIIKSGKEGKKGKNKEKNIIPHNKGNNKNDNKNNNNKENNNKNKINEDKTNKKNKEKNNSSNSDKNIINNKKKINNNNNNDKKNSNSSNSKNNNNKNNKNVNKNNSNNGKK